MTCSRKFAAWLLKIYDRPVRFIKPRVASGGRRAVGARSRQRTLIALISIGPSSARELAEEVGMTIQGVREQMHLLKAAEQVILTKKGNRHIWRAA